MTYSFSDDILKADDDCEIVYVKCTEFNIKNRIKLRDIIMTKDELKKLIAKLLDEGNSLSEVQTILNKEYDEKMTFLDLRVLASELEDIDWTKDEPSEEEGEDDASEDGAASDTEGKTVVEISRLQRPGVALSGSVKFASGATADWVLDQMGRLGLENSDGEPTPEDLKEFQEELQKAVGGGM